MACYTSVEVDLADDRWNREARKRLGLAVEGPLSVYNARRVKVEAGVIKSMDSIRKLDPRAVIRRKGNKLTITVQR